MASPNWRASLLLGVAVLMGLCVGILPNRDATGAAEVKPVKPAAEVMIRPFLQEHCIDCHGPDSAKAGLRLDTLPAEFADPERARTWQKVLDRMQAGEMPPKKRPHPATAETKKALTWVHENLLAADRRAQPPAGSVVLRRLNRVQYENTVRDLLDIDLELQDRLPPDTRAFGFDNIGAVLRLSSAQLEVYLDAADAALDAAIANRARPVGIKQRTSGLDALTQYNIRSQGGLLELEEAAVGFGKLEFHCYQKGIPEDGRYRVRASVFTYKAQGGKPLNIYVRMRHTAGDRVIGYYEAPPDVPAVIEFTTRLKKGSHVMFGVPTQPYIVRAPNAADRPGPGIGVQWVDIEGPVFDSWPPPSHKRLFGDLPLVPAAPRAQQHIVKSSDPPADAERLLTDFMRRAYRRPVTAKDVEPVLTLVKQHLEKKDTFDAAMRVGYKAILCSPHFLFFEEKTGEPDDHALASRLSYLLWNTLPDEELLKAAGAGELRKPATLRAQTERLLKHPKAAGFVRNFLGQWLDLRLLDFTTPDPKLYPEFDTALQTAMAKEPELFFDEMLRNDLSVTNVIDSEFTFLNERLAGHYGIPGVKGTTMRQVAIPKESHRGGMMTMGAVLKVTANGSYTHPVLRGVWVLRNIIGKPPDPPPPNAGAVEPDLRGAKTIREQLDAHRKVAACASCHLKIDPPGFALESFDVTGAWREQYRVLKGPKLAMSKQGPAVEPAYALSDGRAFQNIDGLKKLLLEDRDQIARCVAEKLLIYGTGRGLRYADRAAVEEIVARSRDRGYGLRSLVHDVVQSKPFTNP